MGITYKVIPRKNPQGQGAGPKYYAPVNSKGRRSRRFIAKQIAGRPLNEMGVLPVIEGFPKIVPGTLTDDHSHGLFRTGNFHKFQAAMSLN